MSAATLKKVTKISEVATSHVRHAHPLHACMSKMLDDYFKDLDGHAPGNLYELVLDEIELPLLQAVLKFTRGNQSRAAEILGVNRGTLRKKLRRHKLD